MNFTIFNYCKVLNLKCIAYWVRHIIIVLGSKDLGVDLDLGVEVTALALGVMSLPLALIYWPRNVLRTLSQRS